VADNALSIILFIQLQLDVLAECAAGHNLYKLLTSAQVGRMAPSIFKQGDNCTVRLAQQDDGPSTEVRR